MKIKGFIQWVTNFGSIFSILGFFATLYLGIFYVPSWLKETRIVKIRNAEDEILKSIKEMTYSDSVFSIDVLKSLIRAKELLIEDKLTLSTADFITKTEESFMEDRYLPLPKRKELINELEKIKVLLPKENNSSPLKNNLQTSQIKLTSILSIVLTIFAAILGFISFSLKNKVNKEKDAEILKIKEEDEKKDQELSYLRANTHEARKQQIIDLQKLIPKNLHAPQSDLQWIYDETCLVHDYTLLNIHKIAVDTYRVHNSWEIQLFNRNKESQSYLFETLARDLEFLPKPIENYEVKNNRIIFARFDWNEDLKTISESLKDLLSRIEKYKKANDGKQNK